MCSKFTCLYAHKEVIEKSLGAWIPRDIILLVYLFFALRRWFISLNCLIIPTFSITWHMFWMFTRVIWLMVQKTMLLFFPLLLLPHISVLQISQQDLVQFLHTVAVRLLYLSWIQNSFDPHGRHGEANIIPDCNSVLLTVCKVSNLDFYLLLGFFSTSRHKFFLST